MRLSLSARTVFRKVAWSLSNACLPVLGLALLCGCGYEAVTGRTMGTSYAVTADCPGGLPARSVAAQLRRIESRMSTYDPDSELVRFNGAPASVWVPVSLEVVDVVAAALDVAEATGGAFDPTVAPLVALWGFGVSASDVVPGDAEIRAAKESVGHGYVRYRRSPPALTKDRALSMDLSGIAKGHAVDRIAVDLEARGCQAYLVELGGEMRVRGLAPSGGPWRLGVDSPTGQRHVEAIRLRTGGVATSGDYRQYRERDGRRDSHIIDPRSGRPVRHRLASATVVAASARAADAYATALMVLGEEDGLRFAEEAGLAALFVVRTGDEFETLRSRTMADLVGP